MSKSRENSYARAIILDRGDFTGVVGLGNAPLTAFDPGWVFLRAPFGIAWGPTDLSVGGSCPRTLW